MSGARRRKPLSKFTRCWNQHKTIVLHGALRPLQMASRPKTFKQEHTLGEFSKCAAVSRRFRSMKNSLVKHLVFVFLLVTEKRQAEAKRIRAKYPDRIPVGIAKNFANKVCSVLGP